MTIIVLTISGIDGTIPPMEDSAKKKILVVDDSELTVSLVTTILQRANYAVIGTTSGREAVRIARDEAPSLIMLDLEMPDLDGAKVAGMLAEEMITNSIPIIFLSGMIAKEQEALALPPGRYVMAKPISIEALLAKVKEALDKSATPKQ